MASDGDNVGDVTDDGDGDYGDGGDDNVTGDDDGGGGKCPFGGDDDIAGFNGKR